MHRTRAPDRSVCSVSQGSGRTWQVTGLDWIIVAFAAILAAFGFRRGFIVGVLSFGGFALGAFLGTRAGSSTAREGLGLALCACVRPVRRAARRRDPRERARGSRFRRPARADRCPASASLDGLLGAAARRGARRSASSGSSRPCVAQAPDQETLRADIQRSAILRELNVLLPPSGPILNALARLDPLPSIAGPVAGRLRAAAARSRATPRREGGLAQRRARARHRLRAGDRGLRLGRRAGPDRHQRARGRRRAGHDRAGRRHSPSLPARADRVRPDATTSPC